MTKRKAASPAPRATAIYAFDPRLDLNLFRVLDAIHTHGGISSAARALHLTQPAISHALGRLREVFDDPLFVRHGNRMIPTERTRNVVADIHEHLNGLFAAVAPAEAFRPETLDIEFRVALRDVLESALLPVLLQRLGSIAPNVRIACRPVARDNFEREFASGSLDLAVDRRVRAGEQVSRLHLADEEVAVVVGEKHFPKKRSLTPDDYINGRHVVVTHLEGRDPIDSILAETRLSRRVGLRCLHYFSACQVVAASDMMLTMPRAYALELANVLPIRVLALPLPVSPIQVYMYWHASRDEDSAHLWLREQIIDLARDRGWARLPRKLVKS